MNALPSSCVERECTYLIIWSFPKMVILPSCPELDHFNIETHGDLGIRHFGKLP